MIILFLSDQKSDSFVRQTRIISELAKQALMSRQKQFVCSRRALAGVLTLLLLASVVSCSQTTQVSETAKHAFKGAYPIRVVCTTGMVADVVQRVGGKHVAVTTLMGEGVDPHLYKASTGDLQQLDSADAIFYSGLHLEGKMAELLERLDRRKPTIAVTSTVDASKLLKAENAADPHVWFDVQLWSHTTKAVADALSVFDSTHAADYAANQKQYADELLALDAECRKQLAEIPAERRVLVTAHDAFEYFGRAYNLEVRAIQGISTESEAGVREINALVDFLVQRKIKAVFIETSLSDRNIKALVEGCQSRSHAVTIGGALYSDAMGQHGTPEGTYPGMVRKNVETIVKALK